MCMYVHIYIYLYEVLNDNVDNDYNADNADDIDNVKTYFGSGHIHSHL